MKPSTLFKTYIWLINTIRNSNGISLAEINRRWKRTEMSGGLPFSRPTFVRHKNAIEEMLGVNIDCDLRDGYKYYIDNDRVLRDDSMQNWMISTLAVNNVIAEGMSLQDRILLENVHSGGDWLQMIIDAMKRKVRIDLSYRRYGSDGVKTSRIAPYCIKLFKQRWYVLGHLRRKPTADNPQTEFMTLFSFDRITDIQFTDEAFEVAEGFSAEQYFKNSYGVYVDEKAKVERVVVRAFGSEQFYIDDLPIHNSQRLIAKGDGYADFELKLRPTRDFCGHVISRGAMLKVLEPEWVADEIRGMLKKALDQY